jgi:hypothetical protein
MTLMMYAGGPGFELPGPCGVAPAGEMFVAQVIIPAAGQESFPAKMSCRRKNPTRKEAAAREKSRGDPRPVT